VAESLIQEGKMIGSPLVVAQATLALLVDRLTAMRWVVSDVRSPL
jgi:hypothetical protein